MAMPPSSTAPLREPASSRTAEWASRCHGDESPAWTSVARDDATYGSGQAERGPQGNYDDHETSLQAGKAANH